MHRALNNCCMRIRSPFGTSRTILIMFLFYSLRRLAKDYIVSNWHCKPTCACRTFRRPVQLHLSLPASNLPAVNMPNSAAPCNQRVLCRPKQYTPFSTQRLQFRSAQAFPKALLGAGSLEALDDGPATQGSKPPHTQPSRPPPPQTVQAPASLLGTPPNHVIVKKQNWLLGRINPPFPTT